MNNNLKTLASQIQEHLESHGLVVFHGISDSNDFPVAYWDSHQYPDHQDFIAAAVAAGVRIVTMFANEFKAHRVDDALEMLEDSPLDPEESRTMQKRLRQMKAYDGFTCAIELSFDHSGRTYLYILTPEWYDEFLELRGRLDDLYAEEDDEEEDDDDPFLNSRFSKN